MAVNRDELETRVLDLWIKTRIPLTLAHLQYHTGIKRKKLRDWLDELVIDGTLEVDVDDDGEMVWRVPGAHRPGDGPKSFAELERLDGLRSQVKANVKAKAKSRTRERSVGDPFDMATQALTLANHARGALDRPRGENEKSLLVSAGLSLLGPVGWLYAGALKEAVPATAAMLLLGAILPSFLLMPILFLALPLSSIAGLIYAWQYNRKGRRTTLFTDDPKDAESL